jgi:hypothetical protein
MRSRPRGARLCPATFFNIHDGKSVSDREGTELSGLAEARICAVDLARRSTGEMGDEVWGLQHDWRVEMLEKNRELPFTLHFSAEDAERRTT